VKSADIRKKERKTEATQEVEERNKQEEKREEKQEAIKRGRRRSKEGRWGKGVGVGNERVGGVGWGGGVGWNRGRCCFCCCFCPYRRTRCSVSGQPPREKQVKKGEDKGRSWRAPGS